MNPDQIALAVQNSDKKRCLDKLDWYTRQFMSRLTAVASLLKELRDDPLKPWRGKDMTFEEFCMDTFHLTASRVRQITDGQDIRSLLALEAPELKPVIEQLNERQTRELSTVHPSKRADVLKTAISIDPKPKARTIREAKAKVIGSNPVSNRKDKAAERKTQSAVLDAATGLPVTAGEKTALQWLTHWWTIASPEQRTLFRNFQQASP